MIPELLLRRDPRSTQDYGYSYIHEFSIASQRRRTKNAKRGLHRAIRRRARPEIEDGLEEYLLLVAEQEDAEWDSAAFGDCYCSACLRELYDCLFCAGDTRICGHDKYVDDGP